MEQVVVSGWQRDIIPCIYGYEACCAGHNFGPAMRPYYLLHYVLSGEGKFMAGGRMWTVGKGDIFVIHPEEVTTYTASLDDPWQYAWIGFYYPGQLNCLAGSVIRQPPVRHIFTYIRDHMQQAEPDGKIFSLTHELIWLLDSGDRTDDKKHGSYAAYAKAYMENTYMQPVTIAAIAQSLHIDRRYLTRQFKDAYGMPPQAFLMELRLERASQFLALGFSVSDAAQMAGFADLPNFSRHFKRHFGVSPNRYRK